MTDRRTFLRLLGAAGSALTLNPHDLLGRSLGNPPAYFGIHPFIGYKADAVFILRTNIDSKLNAAAKLQTGLDFATSVIVPLDTPGSSFDVNVVIKPNLTCRASNHPSYTIERSMGIVTDAWFVEGIIERCKNLGVAPSRCFLREVNCPYDFADGGYIDMAARTGADIRDLSGPVSSLPPGSIQWMDVPDGVWFSKIPYLWPVNSPGSLLINIAKFKTHLMGVTGCAKNLQGTIASGYVSHCTKYGLPMNVAAEHIRPDANTVIMENYLRHVSSGIPRWDRPGDNGGIRQEIWATRCLDNNSVTKPDLHIIEGIYGRDGHFMDGPSPEGLATDYMTNIILFGKNPFHVDLISHWLAGHEPGNFGLFHMAVERGLAATIDPMRIPLYEWTTTPTADPRPLISFNRTPLKTSYLRRDFNGQSEDLWHLVNEPYHYTGIPGERSATQPVDFVLRQNYPNPFNSTTAIEFSLPEKGAVRADVLSVHGEIVSVIAEGTYERGPHLIRWNANSHPSGIYFCRLRFNGMRLVRTMVLLR